MATNQQPPNQQNNNQQGGQQGQQTGAQAGNQQGDPPNSQTQPQMVNMTQAQFDSAMQQRLERQQRQIESQYKKQFEALGISGFDDLQQRIDTEREAAAEEERQRIAAMEKAGQTEDLLKHARNRIDEMERAHQQRVQELEGQLLQMQQQTRAQQTQNVLLAAATEAGAINPSQVAQLVSSSIQYDDEGRMYVVDGHGLRRTNGSGQDFTVADLTTEFIEQNPHFAQPASGRGANGQASSANMPAQTIEGLDPTQIHDSEYLIANADKLKQAVNKGYYDN